MIVSSSCALSGSGRSAEATAARTSAGIAKRGLSVPSWMSRMSDSFSWSAARANETSVLGLAAITMPTRRGMLKRSAI